MVAWWCFDLGTAADARSGPTDVRGATVHVLVRPLCEFEKISGRSAASTVVDVAVLFVVAVDFLLLLLLLRPLLLT